MIVAGVTVNGTKQVPAVQLPGEIGDMLADVYSCNAGRDRPELSADLAGCSWFRIPRFKLAHASFEDDKDDASGTSRCCGTACNSWQDEGTQTEAEQTPSGKAAREFCREGHATNSQGPSSGSIRRRYAREFRRTSSLSVRRHTPTAPLEWHVEQMEGICRRPPEILAPHCRARRREEYACNKIGGAANILEGSRQAAIPTRFRARQPDLLEIGRSKEHPLPC